MATVPESSRTDAAALLNLPGTRRAPRFKMVDGAEVSVNSKPATLVDLSLVGAQILTSSRLTPTQGVRFTFEDQGKMVRIRATVVWASFEATSGTPCYRAAIEFLDVDEEPLQRLIDSKRKTRNSSRK